MSKEILSAVQNMLPPIRLWLFLCVILALCHKVHGYIRHDSSDSTNFTYFTPYAQGFVGVYGKSSNFLRERINEGSFENPAKELIYEQAVKTQTCPGMVGPFTDGNYFCTAKEYGYCDRRSGVCFCNIGYQGIDCSECTPSYFKVDYLCYPKKLCPNDCSGAGVCDYWTGTCHCLPHRVGVDCGTLLCKSFNELCEACSTESCLRCPAGYYLTESNDCSSCYDYDPRCAGCTKDLGCTLCADPILTSVRRSGYRTSDPRVPVEEDTREFSITLPFGTKSPESFADAEAFIVATTPDNPLRDNAQSCHQGYNNDETWFCEDLLASHIVCGHKGVFSFTYPNYVINETSRFFRVSVRRSGGGYGNVLVNYFIKHFTTSDNDLTATAPYTTSQTLEFDEGVVERSFLVSIIDDNVVEENEVFQIVLELPEGGGSIGAQFRTNVTIVDDDLYLLSPVFTHPTVSNIVSVAGESFSVPVQAVAADGEDLKVGGERFLAVIENDVVAWSTSTEEYRKDGQRHSKRTLCEVFDGGNGNYSVSGVLKQQGRYQLRIWHAFPLGLMGTYHRDAFMENVALERIDRFVNFTWGEGRLLPRGSDYISIRWTGVIRPDTSDDYFFRVDADDHARLWIDGNLLVDHWHEQRADLEPYRSVLLVKDFLYEVVLEYREVRGDAYARLMWTSSKSFNETLANNGTELESFAVIPPENMYSLHEIGNSPVDVIITSSDTAAAQTECTGDGLFNAVALTPARFRFCPRDQYQNFRDDVDQIFLSSEIFRVTLALEDDLGHEGQGREIIFPELAYDFEAFCFDVVYVPERAGRYQLSIMYHSWHGEDGYHVAGSPFSIIVEPNKMNGPYSPIYGLPSPLYTVAGSCYNFTVVARDGSHNLVLRGGENIQAYMYRVAFFEDIEEEVISTEFYDSTRDIIRYGTVYDHHTGNYSIELCPITTGWYEAHVLLNGWGKSNIPHRVQDRQASQGDSLGSELGSSFRGQYIDRSPYRMYTSSSSAISSVMSSVEVSGSLDGCTVGVLASFVITCRDNWGNVVRNTSPSPSIIAKLLLSPNVISESINLLNGSYRVEFTPEKVGENPIQILIDGSPIKNSPYIVTVADGVAASTDTYASGNSLSVATAGEVSYFVVYSHDLDGNKKSGTGDNYTFVTSLTEIINGALKPCTNDEDSSIYCGDNHREGVYYATFTPTVAGDMNLSIYLNDANGSSHIKSSPFQVRVHPGSPHAENTLVSGTLHNATAGIEYYVHIHLVDKFGNKLDHGGDDVELALHGVAGDWGTIEPFGTLPGLENMYYYAGYYGHFPDRFGMWIDNGDGGYTCSFVLHTTGKYVERLSVAERGLNVTYFNDTSFGYLVDFDDSMQGFDEARNGHDVNTGSTISWTGDIGRRPGASGNLGEGSYFHRFKSRVEPNVQFALKSTEGELSNTAFSVNEKFREDYWSVRYVGLIYAEFPETYNFTVLADAESDVLIRIGGRGSATNGSSLGDEVVRFTSNSSVATGQYTFTDTKMREFVVEYKHITGPQIFLSLLWESPSTKKTIIPESAFRHWRNISHYNLTANPSSLCPSCSTAHGDALSEAVVGTEHTFIVYARDEFGNLMQVGGDMPSMVAVGSNGASFRGAVKDFGNSTYQITYYPTQSGVYRMYVSIGCCAPHPNIGISREIELLSPLLIDSAPFQLTVLSGKISNSKSVAVGPSLISGKAGFVEMFNIHFRDVHGNPTVSTENTEISVVFRRRDTDDTVINHVKDWLNTGTDSALVLYNITKVGDYKVSILVDGVDIVGSPFLLTIRSNEASAREVTVRGQGKSYAGVQRWSHFEITTRDRYGNVLSNGGSKFYVRLVGSHRREDNLQVMVPTCKDHLDGTHWCQYFPIVSGLYELRIYLVQNSERNPGGSGLFGYYYTNSDGRSFDNNSTDDSVPFISRLDKNIDFDFPDGFLLNAFESETTLASNSSVEKIFRSVDLVAGVRIIWKGFLVSPFSDEVMIRTLSVNFNTSVFVDDVLVFDSLVGGVVSREYDTSVHPTSTVSMTSSSVYALRVEAWCDPSFIKKSGSILKLLWSTNTIRESVIPSFYLYSTADEISLSPFPVEVKNL